MVIDNVDVHFRFGAHMGLNNIPKENLIRNNELYFISGFDGRAYDNIYLKNGTYWTLLVNYFANWELELWGKWDGEFQRIYHHKFDLINQNVVFDLQPNNKNEFDIWVEYIKYFGKVKQCNLFLTEGEYSNTQNDIEVVPHGNDSKFYAGYIINWSDSRLQNPLGNNFNPFDLINNKLLRI